MMTVRLIFAAILLVAAEESVEEQYPLHEAVYQQDVARLQELAASEGNIDHKDYGGRTALHCAAISDWSEGAIWLLANRADPNARDRQERTPLHWAAQSGSEHVAKLLLTVRADSEARDCAGRTPLHLAAMGNQPALVRLLVTKGAVVDARGNRRQTPLHWAATYGHQEVAEALIEGGADLNAADNELNTALHRAIRSDRYEFAEVLVKKGADVNQTNMFCRRPDVEKMVEFLRQDEEKLREHRARITAAAIAAAHRSRAKTASRSKGRPPVQPGTPTGEGQPDKKSIIDALGSWLEATDAPPVSQDGLADTFDPQEIFKDAPPLDSKDGPKIIQSGNSKPSRIASRKRSSSTRPPVTLSGTTSQKQGSGRMSRSAVPQGASSSKDGARSPSARSKQNTSPPGDEIGALLGLQDGAQAPQVPGSDVHKDQSNKDSEGRPSLIAAAEEGRLPVVKLLLKQGADVDTRDPYGFTPLHRAAEKGHTEVMELLLNAGCDPDAREDLGKTPLHRAAAEGQRTAVELLFKAGADPNALDLMQRTPYEAAQKSGHEEVARFLLETTDQQGATRTVRLAAGALEEDSDAQAQGAGGDFSLTGITPAAGVLGWTIIATPFVISLFFLICFWTVYAKAGQHGWACVVPIYGALVWLRIAGKPDWWLILLHLPFVQLFALLLASVGVARNFQKGPCFGIGLYLFGFIFYPILALGSAVYNPEVYHMRQKELGS